MALFNLLSSSLCAFFPILAAYPTNVSGPMLYSLHKGEVEKAFEHYFVHLKEENIHDFELLQLAGKAILEQGIHTNDPEIQLMCMFGAGVATSSGLIPILEKGLKSADLKTQLIALNYLCKLQDDEADSILLDALSSPFLITRLEVLYHLAKKNHPEVLEHLYSLLVKVPEKARTVFAQIAVHLEGFEATRFLRQLLADSDIDVRIETILTVAEEKRDDFLPTLRVLATDASCAQQEAAACALGTLNDQLSVSRLKELAQSKQETVMLASSISLYELGERNYLEHIENAAKKGSLYAISALGKLKTGKEILYQLLSSQDKDIRLNAILALLNVRDPRVIDSLDEILIDDGKDLGFWRTTSPGGALKAWKYVTSASQKNKIYPGLTSITLGLREKVLSQCIEFDESAFLKIAKVLIEKKQHSLIPLLTELLQNSKSEAVIQLLQEGHQKAGAPLIRNYCTLALYRLKKPGPYEEHLISWVKARGTEELIRFREDDEPDRLSRHHELTPEETSRFLVEACEALASAQNRAGIEALIHAIAYGNPKNRYALAGLLMRTTE